MMNFSLAAIFGMKKNAGEEIPPVSIGLEASRAAMEARGPEAFLQDILTGIRVVEDRLNAGLKLPLDAATVLVQAFDNAYEYIPEFDRALDLMMAHADLYRMAKDQIEYGGIQEKIRVLAVC